MHGENDRRLLRVVAALARRVACLLWRWGTLGQLALGCCDLSTLIGTGWRGGGVKRRGDQARKAGAAGQAGEAGGAGEARKTSLTRRDMDREQTTAAATTAAAAAAAFASINRSSCFQGWCRDAWVSHPNKCALLPPRLCHSPCLIAGLTAATCAPRWTAGSHHITA